MTALRRRREARIAALHMLYAAWVRLPAWGEGVDLRNVKLTTRFSKVYACSSGFATRGHVHLYLGSDDSDAMTTLLHELAHIAAFRRRVNESGDGHGPTWRAILLAAVEQVCGEAIVARAHAASFPVGLTVERSSAEMTKERLDWLVRQSFQLKWNERRA
jgi:hypothetical protein